MRLERREIMPFEQQKSMIDNYLDLRKKVNESLNPYKAEVFVDIDLENDVPFKTNHAGDLHYGHDHADSKALDEAIKETGDNGILVLHGNIIDGVSNKFISTNTTRVAFDLNSQEYIAKNILQPVIERHQLIALGGNACHEGWAEKTATHDPTRAIVGKETPLVYTGGQIKFKSRNKLLGTVEVYHNSGKGRTNQSPEGSVRERSREMPIGHPDRPEAIIDAHMHQLVAAQDVAHNPITGKDVTTTLGEVGAAKGTKDNPDTFLTQLGVSPRYQPADCQRGLVLIWNRSDDGKLKSYPVAGYNRAERLFQAEMLWERCQKKGNFDEFKEIILAAEADFRPKKIFLKNQSKFRNKDIQAKAEGEAPLYKNVQYSINRTRLPIKIQFIGGLRVGSTSLERGLVRKILEEVNRDQWSYIFATRRLLNQGTSKREDRKKVLKNMADLLSQADKESILGIMMTDELKSNSWGKKMSTKKGEALKELLPGDWLYYKSKLSGIPLILPETVVGLRVGKIDYNLLLRDRLSHFTSLINPYHGLGRIKDIFGINADILVGGHTEVVGWRTWMKPYGQFDEIVPGGFSEYTEKGIGNRVNSVKGGQGVILFPEEKMFFSFATHEDGKDIHQALWLQQGLKNIGMLERVLK